VPSLRLGSPSVDFRIFPDGEVHFYGAYDQLVSDRLDVLAYSFPQKTVPSVSLRDASTSIARVCLRKGIIGFVTVDFVAFPDTKGGLRVWAVDLNFSQSTAHSHFQCFDICCGGGFVPEEGLYVIPHEVLELNEMEEDEEDEEEELEEEDEEDGFVRRAFGRGGKRVVNDGEGSRTLHLERASRSFLATPLLRHPFLSFVQHASFFADCKSLGYSIDLETAQGTIFVVVGSLLSGMLGISSFGKSQQENGARMLKVLQYLFREIENEMSRDSEVLPGESNLETVIEAMQQLMKRMS
jgi:IQ domain-containing protein H